MMFAARATDRSWTPWRDVSGRPSTPCLTESARRRGAPPRDHARAVARDQVGPDPVGEHRQPVAKADQVPEVDEHPGQPGDQARHAQAAELRDRARAADRRHEALVEIVKRPARYARDFVE